MRKHLILFTALATLGVFTATESDAQGVQKAEGFSDESMKKTVILKSAAPETGGEVNFIQMNDGVLVTVEAYGLEPGEHGFHIHETAACTPAGEFTDAGGHFNPEGHSHGHEAGESTHAGDMPNITVDLRGQVQTQVLNKQISITDPDHPGYLYDADGSAVVIHAGADDYKSQPSGEAGARVACGEITEAPDQDAADQDSVDQGTVDQ